MKKRKRILKTTLLLLLCIALAVLNGCGGTTGGETEEDIRLDPAELTEENSFPIRIVNASGRSVGTIEFSWYGDAGECYLDVLGSGDTLEADEVLDTRIQPTDGSYFVQTCAADEGEEQISYLVLYGPDVKEGSVLVLLPDDEQEVQILFDAGTDAQEAEKKALADYQAASEGKPLPSEEETGGLSAEEIAAAAAKLGYESLGEMRTKQHEYLDSNDPVSQGIEGYWYPDGDRESTEYFSIYNGTLYFYEFDPEQGDVQTGMLNLSLRHSGTVTTSGGTTFEYSKCGSGPLRTSNDMEKDTIVFDGDRDTVYYWRLQ